MQPSDTLLPPVSPDEIDAVRRFNRFHTLLVGALNDRMHATDYALPQARVLHEIANSPPQKPPSAAALARELGMDPGYLSRLIATLEKDGVIARTPAPENAKKLTLALTDKGRAAADALAAAARAEVAALLGPLDPRARARLVGGMESIRQLLGDGGRDTDLVVLRDPEPGDLGWIVHRHGKLYAEEYGFERAFEAEVARIVARFVEAFRPGRERCWIAEVDGRIAGSVFVVQEDEATAKLRLLYVEPACRGMGIGRRLVDEALRFARARGYSRMVLWTNDVLVAARRIYQAAGFTLVSEERHRTFGPELVGQIWSRDL